MSRSNYCEAGELDEWAMICWRGAVASAIKGARGQRLFRDLLSALDSMPEKRLIAESLESGGEVCTLGCLGRTKGIDMSKLDPEEPEMVAKAFNVAPALAQEIVYMNDEYLWHNNETPEQRWTRMREWVSKQIKVTPQ